MRQSGTPEMAYQLIPEKYANSCVFTVDVEDWFHILQTAGTPQLRVWGDLPSRVEKNFMRLLDLFETTDVHVTCFFLGWVAERFPHLVREAARRGHEIASHGYAHRLVFEQTASEFLEDAVRAREILEDIIGRPVEGFRCAGFSATQQTPWFLESLLLAHYKYDSSIFPAARQHGGMAGGCRAPHVVRTQSGDMIEFPISVTDVFGRPLCFFGGGYLRLFPYSLIRAMSRRVIRERRPVVFYVHPREIDPDHPRLAMGLHRKFRSYVNLRTTESKIRRILSDFSLVTFKDLLADSTMSDPQVVLSEAEVNHA
jgi:polysaccharide deacetylase family protein (PEP-CTERM system associated)